MRVRLAHGIFFEGEGGRGRESFYDSDTTSGSSQVLAGFIFASSRFNCLGFVTLLS